ncbi:alpha/beta fold hydrolase [Nocardia aurantiaca]|uniref:Alpha/beta fold hydrolase n=1 Tax=Nocardia aurantiaca TaxID=2675850 RepID=A0A6I3KV09_9NOCA|nr:alpha/beta hydrolase [Nocardia aurantiaca]MTE11864.1 alpha/beta fold hydrolase [Nocardia aurantiaca]
MEDFTFDGTRIAYVRQGESGPPVLMLHSAGSSHLIWTPQIAALSREYRVYAVDLPGYGASARPADGYTLERYSELIRAFIEQHGLSGVGLVGNCVGSAISLTLARRHPELIRAVVAINPLTESTAMRGDWGQAARVARALPDSTARALSDWHTPRWVARRTARAWFTTRRAYRECPYVAPLSSGFPARALIYLVRDLSSFAALDDWPDHADLPPICVIWGNQNRVLSAAAGRAVNAMLRPDRAEYLDGCGHVPMLERAADVTAIIGEFLAAHLPADSVP